MVRGELGGRGDGGVRGRCAESCGASRSDETVDIGEDAGGDGETAAAAGGRGNGRDIWNVSPLMCTYSRNGTIL